MHGILFNILILWKYVNDLLVLEANKGEISKFKRIHDDKSIKWTSDLEILPYFLGIEFTIIIKDIFCIKRNMLLTY